MGDADVDDRFWINKRSEVLLDADSINLNTGSFAPLPRPVKDALDSVRRMLFQSPSDFHWRQVPPLLDRARKRLADYLNAPADRLLLLPNTTFAVNVVANSLPLGPGDEVLMTDQEYGAMRMCWDRRCAERGAALRKVAIPFETENPAEIVDAIGNAIRDRTRILFFSHVTSPTGLVLPARELCELARRHGITSVIDGAHAPGMVRLDLPSVSADYYAGNAHKWLMAPSGSAFLHVAGDGRESLAPVVTSWGWEFDRAQLHEPSGWGGSFWARLHEFHGTMDRSPILVLPEVLDFRASLVPPDEEEAEEAISRRVFALVACLRDRLGAIGMTPATPANRALSGSMTAFHVPNVEPVRARDILWHRYRIEAPFTQSAGKTFLRVSTAWFNTRSEIDDLAEALANFPFQELV